MRQKLLILLPFIFIISNLSSKAQNWAEMMHDANVNYYDTRAAFDSAWAGITPQKGKGYKVFERWSEFMEPRVFPKGNITDGSRAYEEFNNYLEANPQIAADLETRAANWLPLGPTGAPGNGGGAGRVNFVRFDPTNSANMFLGTPAGGLWKSTNSGASWSTNTDQLAVIGCSDIAIDPTNTQIMYLATGDGDGGDTYSVGVLKSTNGGTTWNTTGLTFPVSNGYRISRLLINPSNPLIIIAATNDGIFRTVDGGTTWPQIAATNNFVFNDMEFRPTDPTTIYAAGDTYWKSTNSGAAFTQITATIPTGVTRLALAVTPANNTYVYMLAANNTNGGLTGVYRSTDNGATFTLRSSTPNYLGFQSNGGDVGGQGWYDLCIAASNTNADVVLIGGINVWRSTNGGTSFTINAAGYGGAPYIHPDIHDLIFLPGSGTQYYAGNDGGIYRTTNDGANWTDLSGQLQIAEQYRIGLSPTVSGTLVAGHQDNGCNRLNAGVWTEIYGGDGMDCFINRTNNALIYESYVYGEYRRSTNSGTNWINCFSSIPNGAGNASWLSTWHQDPVTATTFYAGGRAALYRTVDITVASGGWVALGTPSGTGNIVEFDIAPSNNQIIYAIKSNAVSRSSNGGTSWTNITGTLPVGSAALTNVEVCTNQPNKVWVTFSGYSAGNKVYMTTNGGTSWTNYSTGLPNLPANCILFQTGTAAQTVYVGTDIGVYVRDSVDATWNPYLAGLPRVPVRDLEIYYSAPVKLRAGTYGRGTWESDTYTAGGTAPIAGFTSSNPVICPGQTVTFTDISSFSPTSWSWTFAGGTPATSTLQNPVITYNTPGVYDVTLTATNGSGSNTVTQTAYITVTGPVALPLVEGFEGPTFAPANWSLTDANGDGTFWLGTTSAGGFGASAQSAAYDNFNNNEGGSQDDMRTPKYIFTGLTTATMTFDVAYARYSAVDSDTLEVLVSTNCGVNWTQVYIKGGTLLSTNGGADQTTIFIPTAAQWRTETVNLNAYVGQANVMVAFRNHGRYGNVVWVDNVNISGTTAPVPVASFTTSGNSICVGGSVTYTNTSSGATSFSWNFPGGAPVSGTTSPITVTYAAAGTYTTTLTATNAFGNSTSTQTITVNANPTANATNTGPFCVGGIIQLNSVGGSATDDWMGPNAYVQNNVQNPTLPGATTAMAGVYTVTVTNAAGCTATATTTVVVNTNPTASATNTGPYCAGATIQLNSSGGSATDDWAGPGGYTAPNTQNPSRPAATVAMSGIYTVTVTNAAGCTSTSTTTVVVNANPTASATNTGPYCAGATIQLNSGGGSATDDWLGPLAYNVPNTQNPTIPASTVAMSGLYTVTVTNAAGCTSQSTTNVVVNANPTALATNTGPYCVGATIQLNSSGGSATDDWAGPGGYTANNIQNPTRPASTLAMAGIYTVTVTNAAGCTSTSTTTVVVNANPTATATNTGPYCAGATIQLNSVGGSATDDWLGPLAYNVPNTQNPTIPASTVAMSGLYTVTVTNAAGCTSQSTTNVVVNANPTALATNTGPYCVGATIQLNSSGGSATDDWAGPGGYTAPNTQNPTRPVATLAMAGIYTVTVTNAAGCTSTSTTTVVVNTAPAATASNTGPYCVGGTIQLNSSGGGTYAWTGPGAYSNATQNPTRGGATVGMAGVYTVVVTLGAGCTASATTTVVVNTNPTASATNTGPYCVGTTIQLNSGGGSATDDWLGPNAYSQNNLQNPTIPGSTLAMAGLYTVTVTNAAGCTSTSTTNVVVNANPTANATNGGPYCVGATIQLNSVGGSATDDWAGPGAYTANNVQNPTRPGATVGMSGIYTVTVTNAAGCTSTSTTTVTVSAASATASNTGPYCVGATIQLNSSGGGTYAWTGPGAYGNATQNPSRPGATVGMAGVYTVTVTLGGGCTASATTTVVVNTNPTASATNTGPYCVGTTIQLNSGGGSPTDDWLGPNAYSQNDVQNPTLPGSTVAMAGLYTVTVTNAAGCTSTSTTNVVVNTLPTNTASNTGPYCVGTTIQLNATAGAVDYDWIGPNVYAQNNTQNPTIPSSSLAMNGVYTVTITNAAGCTTTSTTNVVVNANPIANPTNTGPYCVGATIQLNSSGGSATDDWAGPLSYNMPNTQNPTLPGATVGMAGLYTVTLTNGAGCTSTSTTNVVVNTNPTASATNTGPYCAGATIQLNSVGGSVTDDWTGPLSYNMPNTQNPTLPGSTVGMSGLYTVTVTNAAGCTSTSTTNVVVNALPVASAGSNTPLCEGQMLNLNSAGGIDFDWTGPNSYVQTNSQNPSIPGTVIANAGIYTVTVTDAAGCSNTAATTVVINTIPVIVASSNSPVCLGNNIDLLATNFGGAGYSWLGPNSYSSGTQNPTIVGSIMANAGTYTVTANNSGCIGTSTVTVVVNGLPTATASSNSPVCEGASLDLSSTGGTIFDWTGPNSYVQGNMQNPSINPALPVNSGIYTVTVTDANGCTATATTNAVVNASPVVPTITESGDTLYASPTAGMTFQWYMNGSISSGETNSFYVVNQTANYSVVITNASGCTSTSTDYSYVSTVSIEGHEDHEHINVFPNPNEGTFNVTVSSTHAEEFNLRIYNMLGQVVYQKDNIATSTTEGYKVDLTAMAVGTYNMVVYIHGKAHSMKVVKK